MRLLLLLFLLHIVYGSIFEQTAKGRCQPIEIALCKDLPYNYTYYPNSLLNNDQHTLQTHTEHFKPLMKTKCHRHIHFFICSVFAPMCPSLMPQAVTSCRSVCEQVKADCVSILEEFGIGWPEPLACSNFPDPPELCMKPADDEPPRESKPDRQPAGTRQCPADLIDEDPQDSGSFCATPCRADLMFDAKTKSSTRVLSIGFATSNCLFALSAFLTFLIDRKRFRFPERCVPYLSLCLLLSSLPYLLPLFFSSDSLSCRRLPSGQSVLVSHSLDNPHCLVSFLLSYFFSTSASLWWLMFAFTLYLSGGRKWVPEGLDACSGYMHFVAWGLSAVATIAALLFNKVDASELTGICSVGESSASARLLFVLIPRSICLVVGALFAVGAFTSMCRERNSFRTRGTDTSKLEKLMYKLAVFCALFVVPQLLELVCVSYGYLTLSQWNRATWQCKLDSGRCHRPLRPQAEIYIAAVLCSLCTGFACLLWVFSPKTLLSWRRFLCCGVCSPPPSKSEPSQRPLLEPPSGPPPQPPQYLQMTTTQGGAWRPSKVV